MEVNFGRKVIQKNLLHPLPQFPNAALKKALQIPSRKLKDSTRGRASAFFEVTAVADY